MKTDAYTLIRVNLYIDTTGLAEKKFACSKACIKNAPKIGFFLGKEKGVFLASAMSHVIWKIVLGWKKGGNLVYNGIKPATIEARKAKPVHLLQLTSDI